MLSFGNFQTILWPSNQTEQNHRSNSSMFKKSVSSWMSAKLKFGLLPNDTCQTKVWTPAKLTKVWTLAKLKFGLLTLFTDY
jgi:hypothetical protein